MNETIDVEQGIASESGFFGLGRTVWTLTAGTLLLFLGFSTLWWVRDALAFLPEATSNPASALWPVFGILAMSTLGVLLFAYGWALVVRGLTTVVAVGVDDASRGRQ